MTKLLVIPVIVLLLVGCGGLHPPKIQSQSNQPVSSSPRTDLILAVANARSSLDTYEVGFHWIGTYGGTSSNGCERVRLQLADRTRHEWHYLVCNQRDVTEINKVAPLPPKGPRLDQMFDSLSNAAWRTGRRQTMRFEAYELEAEPVGPESRRGCSLIDQRVIWNDVLVDYSSSRVCGR